MIGTLGGFEISCRLRVSAQQRRQHQSPSQVATVSDRRRIQQLLTWLPSATKEGDRWADDSVKHTENRRDQSDRT